MRIGGWSTCRVLAERGASVVVADLDGERARAVALPGAWIIDSQSMKKAPCLVDTRAGAIGHTDA